MWGKRVIFALLIALMVGCVSAAGINENEGEVRSGGESRGPPVVQDLWFSEDSVNRTQSVMLYVDASDDIDSAHNLDVTVEHRHNGTTTWSPDLLGNMVFNEGLWQWDVTPKVDTLIGYYDFRAAVEDTGGNSSGHVEFPNALEVLNNLPTAPEVSIQPGRPVTMSTLLVEVVKSATDIEGSALTYHYQWYCDGERMDHLTDNTVGGSETTKGQNWSVEVRAYDGIGEGQPGTAWMVIQNAPPFPKVPLPDPEIDEDTTNSDWLRLTTAFEDPDGDTLTWFVDPTPVNIVVEIDPITGVVTLAPVEDWYGEESITFVATDGEFQVNQTIAVMVLPVNDAPRITSINGEPVVSDPVEFTVNQDELLVIQFAALDVEGHDLIYGIDTTMVTLDATLGEIHFLPDNDMIGWLLFSLVIYDNVNPTVKVTLNFSIGVLNVNDPMDDPEILAPTNGAIVWQNDPNSFIAVCDDPDIQYGQMLVFSWSSSVAGEMGIGANIQVALHEIGVHEINLTVSDGEYSKTTSIEVIVAEYDNDGDGVADSADDFPTDPAASVDSDEDGYPDEWNEGKTETDSLTGLTIDHHPANPNKWKKDEDESPSLGLVGAIVAIGILAGLMRGRDKKLRIQEHP